MLFPVQKNMFRIKKNKKEGFDRDDSNICNHNFGSRRKDSTDMSSGLFALNPPRQSSRQADILIPGRLGEAPAPGNFARPQSKQALHLFTRLTSTSITITFTPWSKHHLQSQLLQPFLFSLSNRHMDWIKIALITLKVV